jgi:hypothetical protein
MSLAVDAFWMAAPGEEQKREEVQSVSGGEMAVSWMAAPEG